MAYTKFTCPECGHSFSSPGGATATCPKCNTEFADDGMPGGQGGEKWSYRSSWQRYAVLTVLVVAMGVLGFMLYEKRTKQSEATQSGDDGDDIKVSNYAVKPGQLQDATPLKQLPAPGSPAGPAGTPRPDNAPPPKSKGRTAADLTKHLVGTWKGMAVGEMATVEYKADGTFTYTAAGAKAISGTWKVEDPTNRGSGPTITWTAEGQTIPPAPLSVRGDRIEKHPLLHRPTDAAVFERK